MNRQEIEELKVQFESLRVSELSDENVDALLERHHGNFDDTFRAFHIDPNKLLDSVLSILDTE